MKEEILLKLESLFSTLRAEGSGLNHYQEQAILTIVREARA